MLFVRVHLDDNDNHNGAMKIALGSHRRGAVLAQDAEAVAQQFPIEVCRAKRGDVLILNMLTLHASTPSESDRPRRVFRLDYAGFELPEPLAWT